MNVQHTSFQIENSIYYGIKLYGKKIESRVPTHTIILLDTSGSMNDNDKLSTVKNSINFLNKFLQGEDIISLITFNNESKIIFQNLNTTSESKEAFTFIVNTIKATGRTNLSAGLFNVKKVLQESPQNIKTGLIILTDGHTNDGITRTKDILKFINHLLEFKQSLSITTIGYGDDHNALLLKDIGSIGGGSYNIVSSQEEVATVFGEILGGLISCVAQSVAVSFPESVKCLNLYPSKTTGTTTTLTIGDIYSESETVLIFQYAKDERITITGNDVATFSDITHHITCNQTIVEPLFIVAYIRCMVVKCLEYMTSEESEYETVKYIYKNLKLYINEPSIQYHPIIPFLKNELIAINEYIENGTIDLTTATQHSAFLNLGRGLSSIRPIENLFQTMTLQSPFSNNIQREITQAIQQLAQDPQ